MTDLFRSTRLKIGRAKFHVSDLDSQITRFFDEHPHEIVIEDDAEPGYKVHKARLTHPIPSSLGLTAGDCLTNLRAALDHIGHSVALALGIAKPRSYYFPFAGDADRFANDKRIRDRCSQLPEQIWAIFAGFQPYKDGNTLLWALNEMRNRDSHAVIMPICIANYGIHITYSGRIDSPITPHWDHSKNEIALIRTRDENLKYDLALALEIGFDGPEPLDSEPMIETLNILVDIVENILMRVEEECRAIGLVV